MKKNGKGKRKMERLYEYKDRDFYLHHTRSERPDPENSTFSLQLHDKNELYYCISGRGAFLVEGQPYELRPGMVMILRAGEAHSLHIQPDEPYERMTLLFSPRGLDGVEGTDALLAPYRERSLGRDNCFLPEEFSSAHVRALMDEMLSGGSDAERRLAIRSNLPAILAHLRRVWAGERHAAPETAPGIAGEIAAYINEHLADEWDLGTLEGVLHRNRDYLNRRFRETMGSSIWDYTIHKRIAAARQDILEGYPIGEVFEKSGFRDYSTFYRHYKAVTGVSPSEDAV